MQKSSFAVALIFTASALGFAGSALAAQAQPADYVCLVTFANDKLATARDVTGTAMATVMPRPTAAALANKFSKIFNYQDLTTTVRACQCLGDPVPASNMAERYATQLACPKPTRVD